MCVAFNSWLFLCSFHSLYGKKTKKQKIRAMGPSSPFSRTSVIIPIHSVGKKTDFEEDKPLQT